MWFTYLFNLIYWMNKCGIKTCSLKRFINFLNHSLFCFFILQFKMSEFFRSVKQSYSCGPKENQSTESTGKLLKGCCQVVGNTQIPKPYLFTSEYSKNDSLFLKYFILRHWSSNESFLFKFKFKLQLTRLTRQDAHRLSNQLSQTCLVFDLYCKL